MQPATNEWRWSPRGPLLSPAAPRRYAPGDCACSATTPGSGRAGHARATGRASRIVDVGFARWLAPGQNRLLDVGLIRVRNAEYATDNDTYGLTTLRKRHARVDSDRIVLDFVGKGGKHRLVEIRHRETALALSRCADLPGYTLLQFVDETGRRQRLSSAAVNSYLESHARAGVSAKDFRTWGGTAHAVSLLVGEPRAERDAARKRQFNAAIRATAQRLGNTPAVCKRHSVHPALEQVFADGTLEDLWRSTHRGRGRGALSRFERVALKLAERGLR